MAAKTQLTAAQLEAVNHRDGPLLVLAGPGSGKTRVITQRIARLIEQGVGPHQILAITFTNKAATEMANRVQSLLPGSRIWISTFHRLCARLLRRYSSTVGLQANFTILDQGDQKQLVKQVLGDLDVDASSISPSQVANRISKAKNQLQTAEGMQRHLEESVGSFYDRLIAKAYAGYQDALLKSNAVDFDDLLLHVCTLLAENPEIRAELDERFRYVLVDEYQDTNLAQYQIITALSQDYPNLCATGDPDQSIYGWRGAEIGNILRFESDFPQARVVRLEQNYRSTSPILQAADSLISNNVYRKAKRLFTEKTGGDPVELLCFENQSVEADEIARKIRELANSEQRDWSQFAIFYRVNALSRAVELALARHRIPFQVAAGVAFYERAEVKDLLAYLRLIFNPADRTAFLRIINTPLRGIGKNTQTKISDFADRAGLTLLEAARQAKAIPGLSPRTATLVTAFAQLMRELSDFTGAGVAPLVDHVIRGTRFTAEWNAGTSETDAQRVANVEELRTAAQQYDEQHPDDASLEGFLETTSLVADLDAIDEHAGKVTLMTLHAAKGLEFPVVFMIAVEHGLLPHQRSIDSGLLTELEEERRLLFVGVTRAEERLFLTHTWSREFQGRTNRTIPSSFLREMDLELNQLTSRRRQAHADEDPVDQPDDDESHVQDPAALSDDEGSNESPHGHEDDWGHAHSPDDESGTQEPGDLGEDFAPGRAASNGRPAVAGPGSAPPLLNSQVFSVGMSVRHPRMGLGEVIAAQGEGKWGTVTVEFQSGERIKFIANKSPLQPVGLR